MGEEKIRGLKKLRGINRNTEGIEERKRGDETRKGKCTKPSLHAKSLSSTIE